MARAIKSGHRASLSVIEAVEARRMFSGGALQGVNVNNGIYAAGRPLGAWVAMSPFGQQVGTHVTLALSKDGVVGNGDDVVLGTADAAAPPDWMPFATANFAVTLPASLAAGNYRVVASTPGGDSIVGPTITVRALAAGKDLAFEVGSMYPHLWPGLAGRANAIVQNLGSQNTGSWTMAVYMSKDRILGNGDDVLVASGSPTMGGTGIDGAETQYASIDFDPQVQLADGIYYPIMVLDPQGEVAETDETNNVVVGGPVTVGPPIADLRLQTVSVSGRTDAGSTLGVDVTGIRPPGEPGGDVRFELVGADGSLYELGGVMSVPAGPDSGATVPAAWHLDLSVPTGVPAGEYQLRLLTEINGSTHVLQVEEQDAATIGPEVWVGMDAPTASAAIPISAGSVGRLPVVVSNTAKNRVKQEYQVTYYLSDDKTPSAGDRVFSRQRITTTLGAGGRGLLATAYQLPNAAKLGTQYLIAVAEPVGTSGRKANRAALKQAGAGRVTTVVPVEITASQISGVVRSVQARGTAGTRVTVRVWDSGSAGFNTAVTVQLFGQDGSVLATIKKRVNVKAGKYADVVLNVGRLASKPVGVTIT